MLVNQKIEMEGRFRVVVRKAGAVKSDTGWFKNLILDAGLDRIGFGPSTSFNPMSAVVNTCVVGRGTSQPVPTQTSLDSFVAAKSGGVNKAEGSVTVEPIYGWTRSVFQFAEGAVTGSIAEVGISWTSTQPQNNLFSRARIKNSIGEEIQLVVLADETLEVTYELRLYPLRADTTMQYTLNGVQHTITVRPASVVSWTPANLNGMGYSRESVRAWSGDIGNDTQEPSGTAVAGGVTYEPYVNGSRKLRARVVWGLNDANFPGFIKAFSYITYAIGSYQFGFVPPIEKNNNRILTIVFELSWARHDPGI